MRNLLLSLSLAFPLATWGQRPELIVPVGHSWGITSVAFSPPCPDGGDCPFGNGKYVLTGGGDGIATLWSTESGKQLQSFEGHLNGVSSVAFSPDGSQVLTGSWDGTAKLWDFQSGKEIRPFERYAYASTDFSTNHSQRITAVAFSPNGDSLLTSFNNDTTVVWDVDSGEPVRVFKGNPTTLCSSKKQELTKGSGYSAILRKTPSGDTLQTLSGHSSSISAAAFSPDEAYVLTGSKDHTAILWEIRSGKKAHIFNGHSAEVTAVAFSSDGNYALTGSSDNTAILWDARSGRRIRTLKGHTDVVLHLEFSPDGRYLLVFSMNVEGESAWSKNKATIWDMYSGQRLSTLILDEVAQYSYPPIDAAFSPDGQRVLIGSRHVATLWDIHSGAQIYSLDSIQANVTAVAFSEDGKYALTGGKNALRLWDAQSGVAIRRFEGVSSKITAVAFSRDGKYALSGGDKAIILWDVSSGLPVRPFDGVQSEVTSLAFSPDGQYAVSGHKITPVNKDGGFFKNRNRPAAGDEKAAILWQINSGKEVRSFKREATRFTDVAFSPDGNYLLTGYTDDTNKESPEYTASLWDRQTGRLACSSPDFTGQVFRGAFSPDGKYLIAGNWTNTIKVWDLRKGEELARLNSLDSTDWVVTTPAGLFDASPGAMELMHYVVKDAGEWETIELNQLKERYYEPGLLQKLLGYSDEPARRVDGLDTVALYPIVSLKLDSQSNQLQIDLIPRNGGLGKVSVFLNGKELIEDHNPQHGFGRQGKISLDPIRLEDYARYFLQDSLNTISVRAYNEGGWLISPAHTLAYRPGFARAKRAPGDNPSPSPSFSFQPVRDPALYAIIVGTANYAGDKLDLKFPGKDAAAMAQAIQQAGGQLFEDRVHVRLFTTDTTDRSMHPTRANIKAAFDDFKRQANAEDILLVYLSGHGVTYGDADRAQFYYLTQDISSENLSDEAVRRTRTLSTDTLTKWINDIPAQKQVMILDACNSGKVVEALETGTKNLNSSQIRALDRMKDRTGMYVLAGSAADKVSYEASQYGQGLLTYSLLDWMKYRAIEGDSTVDVVRLFEYARDQVPVLARDIGGVQTPTLATPSSGGFSIGIINEKVEIPLPQVKPVFVRNVFLDEDTFYDALKIGKRLEGQLQEITAKGARASLIYVDVPEYKNAYSINGLYQVKNGEVALEARLFKGQAALGTIEAKGQAGQLNALVEEILRKAFRILQEE
ncbi:MAG: caspase family protein [Lewinellaceae bacterium]|nr:caspase family protein [Lewinellaceae bacterium]